LILLKNSGGIDLFHGFSTSRFFLDLGENIVFKFHTRRIDDRNRAGS
jgi:hypothetical protein